MVFPHDLPESEQIVKYKNNKCSLISLFWYLFKKYIDAGHAILEINISSKARHDITYMLKNKYTLEKYDKLGIQLSIEEKNEMLIDLLPLFETCRVQVIHLLQPSYSRFKNTPEFAKVVDEVVDTIRIQ